MELSKVQAQGTGTGETIGETLLLDATLQAIPYGFCVWSPDFTLVMWNKHYADIYGFDFYALKPGMSLIDICAMSARMGNHPGETAEEFFASYSQELQNNRGGARAKAREQLAGGRIIETAHVFSPGLGWVITHEDVTDEIATSEMLQRRKHELEQQNVRLDAIVNNISQGLCLFDGRGRLVLCNEAYQRIYALPDDLVRPGTEIDLLMGFMFDHGMTASGNKAEYIAWRHKVIDRRKFDKTVNEFRDRIILMQHHPMEDGGFVSTHEDITEQRQTEARIEYLARHDALTGLPNRIRFVEEMEKAEAPLKRGEGLAVLGIDLDDFKGVNDTLGHTVGDHVLSAVGERLRGIVRETDIVARLGGDEFALLLTSIEDPLEAAAVADRIIHTMSEPFNVDGHQILIGASVGIAVGPEDGNVTDTLLKNADLALYKAKSEGRSTYHFFEAGLDAALQHRRTIEVGLRLALYRNELRLAFQPLLGLKENRVTCLEALLRWDHAEKGPIPPSEFIPIAEETGLIVPIGEWVLREATKHAATWPGDVRVAVNLSPVQFRNRNLVSVVQSALSDAGLSASRLELEITESLLLNDSEQTLNTLHALRAMGIRISMDDFGTGYSSLSYLRSFPFDKIKIDRSFMQDLGKTSDSLAIIKAVIGLGQSLGMSTTAEGVETPEQLEAVRSQGANEVQGFLFSPPLKPEAVPELLGKRLPVVVRKAS